ncbi:hypothetical protein ACVIJ6_001944 [Bradyrhizobium sp. USDA 4369]
MTVSILCAKPTALSVPSPLVGEGQGGGPTTWSIVLDKIPVCQIPSHRFAPSSPLRGGVGGGGPHGQSRPEPSPSLALPHKRRGNAVCGGREREHGSLSGNASTPEALPA